MTSVNLRAVKYREVKNRYMNGGFDNMKKIEPIPEISDFFDSSNSLKKGSYYVKEKDGKKLMIVTSGSNLANKICHTCILPYDNEPVGFPTKITETSKGNYVIHIYRRTFCSYECALYYAQSHHGYEKECQSLKRMYNIETSEVLRACKDPLLLINNGGCLDPVEWKKSLHYYHRSPKITIQNAVIEFSKFTGNE